MGIMEKLNSDKEIVSLRNEFFKLYGYGCPWHFECFLGIEDYRQYLKDKVQEARLKKGLNELSEGTEEKR